MNNEIYDRLSSLYEKLGISHPNGSAENGELIAYCTAIYNLYKSFELYFEQMFADTSSGLGLSLFCELFKIDSSLSDSRKRELIRQGLAQQYGDYTNGDFEAEIDDLAAAMYVNAENFVITIDGSVEGDDTLLPRLGRIFENYLMPCTLISLNGDGFDFDHWDTTLYLFKDYDNINVNFQFLDELK